MSKVLNPVPKTNPDAFPQRIELDIEIGFEPEYPNSGFFRFPFAAYEIFGSRARIPVKLTLDGQVFRRTLAPMGGCHMMVFNQELRDKTGYKAGDVVHIVLERDYEPRTVEIPPDVQSALETADLLAAFRAQSYSQQKERMDWVNDAKRPETRARRIARLIEALSS